MPGRRPGAGAFVLVAFALFGLAACGGSSKQGFSLGPSLAPSARAWPAPSDPMARARAAGLQPETAERLHYHVHSHLDVFVNGEKVIVPAGLGIDVTNRAVHAFKVRGQAQFGGVDPPCNRVCISPLHTHDASGTLHTESATEKNNTLGQLFTEWNVRLTAKCVATYCRPKKAIAVYVDGKKFAGDPRTIPLTNLEEIAVVIGTPPLQIPDSWTLG